jgi:DNA-directed RNA polymerase specialized sigma24 family protein
MENRGSVTLWLGRLQAGDSAAADGLWERYFCRLQALARAKLPTALRRNGSEEDVALDAFASLWRGVEDGRFPELASRDHLWRLLVVITLRKVYRLARTELRERAAPAPEWELEQVLAREPDPEVAAMAADECRRLMAALGDAQLEAVAWQRMEGLTVPEIAAKLACSPRTVDRKLALIQTIWAGEIEV